MSAAFSPDGLAHRHVVGGQDRRASGNAATGREIAVLSEQRIS